ncbi:hypothetical protein HYX13_01840, partial [Candidatus Woesearchaeota archaeon]|nr:hypothetical protein [Candidatus Woesearchaeota archaeon]
HAYGKFTGRGSGEADTLLRLRFPGGMFLQDFRVNSRLYVHGEADIFLQSTPGASPFALAGIEELFPEYQQSIQLPNLTAEGKASYQLHMLMTAKHQYEFLFFQDHNNAVGFGITDITKFGKDESGTIYAKADFDSYKLLLSGAFSQQWIRNQRQSHTTGLYFLKEGWQKNLWYAAVAGMQTEATHGLIEQRKTNFSGSASVENSYQYQFTQEKKLKEYYNSFQPSGYANFAFGLVLPLDFISPEPFFGYTLSPAPQLAIGSIFEASPLVGMISYARYLNATEEIQLGFIPQEGIHVRGYVSLDKNKEKIREYFRDLQRAEVRDAGYAVIDQATAELYSRLDAPAVLLAKKDDRLEVQAIFSDTSEFFFATGYELGFADSNIKIKLLLGTDKYQLQAGYGVHTQENKIQEKFQGEDYEFSFHAALGDTSSLLLSVQPLRPLYGEEALDFESIKIAKSNDILNDFRVMATVQGRF